MLDPDVRSLIFQLLDRTKNIGDVHWFRSGEYLVGTVIRGTRLEVIDSGIPDGTEFTFRIQYHSGGNEAFIVTSDDESDFQAMSSLFHAGRMVPRSEAVGGILAALSDPDPLPLEELDSNADDLPF